MPTAPAEPAGPASHPVPFGGRGAAGAAWKVAVLLLAAAALLIALYGILAAQVELDPRDGDQDARSWQALGAVAFGSVIAMGGFVAWTAANLLAGFGLGRLARPVLWLGAAVAAAVLTLCAVILPGASAPTGPTAFLGLALASLAGSLVALRKPMASIP